jgi:Domain of Unknown Function with PDB structure (DUF3857)/Transglutaminase-like superfamily
MSLKLRICLTGIFLFLQIYLSAQEKAEIYIKQNIPDSIIKDADGVCRLNEIEVEIKSPAKIIIRRRNIYTILDAKAEELSNFYTGYNKLTNINSVHGVLYNSAGKEIRHFKKGDMSDFANLGEAFVSDARVKVSRLPFNSFPYTIDFNEEIEIADAYAIPEWRPPRSDKMAVEISRYILTAPLDYKVRMKLINADVKPIITQKKDKVTYTWEIRNLPVIPKEPFALSPALYDPFMLVGSSSVEMEGYKGDISTWDGYGKFYRSLYEGRDILPDDLKKTVHLLTDNLPDPYKKIDVLYNYLQKNSHYVLISFGIGGLQPYDAAYVAKNKYGDCKALSNFMVALLKEAGIKAYPVVIWGGKEIREFIPDFPSHQGNHMICAVPVAKDTVWLECTSQSLPPGYLSGFTANRYGLMVDENGGSLVHTPAYLLNDNISIRKIFAKMDPEGNLHINSESKYRALSYDRFQSLIHDNSREEQMEYLKKELDLPTYTINSFDYKEDNTSRLPVIQERLDISVSSYAHITGKRVFIDPNILQRSEIKLPEEKERKLDYWFKNEYREIDSVEILIPAGYVLESRSKDLQMETPYGKYITHLEIRENKIVFYRYFDQYSGRFPASGKKEIESFYNQIYEADHTQIVLIKISGS